MTSLTDLAVQKTVARVVAIIEEQAHDLQQQMRAPQELLRADFEAVMNAPEFDPAYAKFVQAHGEEEWARQVRYGLQRLRVPQIGPFGTRLSNRG